MARPDQITIAPRKKVTRTDAGYEGHWRDRSFDGRCYGWKKRSRRTKAEYLRVIQYRYPTQAPEPMKYSGPEVVLFKNDRKERDTQPDYTGTWTTEEGAEFFASAWLNKSKSTGKRFLSIKMGNRKQNQTERDQAGASGNGTREPRPGDYSDDEIPF